jgi:hypothetical protein
MNEATKWTPSRGVQVLHVVLIVLIFMLVGPGVGTIVIAILKGLTDGSWAAIAEIPASIFLGLVLGVGHSIGGIPAAVAGLIVGIKQVYFGGAGWPFALSAGVLVGIPLALFFGNPAVMGGNTKVLTEFCVVTTLSTLACWWVVKSWFVDREVAT